MPTIISHAAVPLAVGLGLGEKRIPIPLLIAGVAASMVPDADVIFFRFGATYDSAWAHRGLSHSLGFAVLLGIVASICLRKRVPALVTAGFIALSAGSHGLLDMLTTGGHGVAILWPLTTDRYFFDWRPIQVSPLSASRFFARVGKIAQSDIRWIWLPALVVALGLRASKPVKKQQ
jgi:inner membrane protein